MNKDTKIVIIRNNSYSTNLSFDLNSFYTLREILIDIDGDISFNDEISPDYTHLQFPIHNQISTIRFVAIDPPMRPADIPILNNRDTRELSFSIWKVSIDGSIFNKDVG